jgi:hypothetical protein
MYNSMMIPSTRPFQCVFSSWSCMLKGQGIRLPCLCVDVIIVICVTDCWRPGGNENEDKSFKPQTAVNYMCFNSSFYEDQFLC